jgi:glycosyltransferase involved in cell wall biosynthesis
MNSLRLVLITPRYWPHTGDLESTAAHLATGFTELGLQVTVLTGSWGPEWPKSFALRGVSVNRVAHAPRGGWSTFRYLTAVSRWLREHQQNIDLVYALNLRYEGYAAITGLRGTKLPVVLRSQDCGPGGDSWWQSHTRFGARIRRYCQQADAIVVPDPRIAEELAGQTYDQPRLQVIPLGVVPAEPRSADRRFRARAALADINQDLAAAEYAPVALFVGRLDDVASLSHLITEWQEISARWPSARLWLVGEGPARDRLGEQVVLSDLRYQVFLPGAFEDWSDLYQAADIFVSPMVCGRSQLILDAMAAGLPVIATDSPDLRGMMEHGTHGLLVPAREQGAWSKGMSQLFEAPQRASEMGAAASKLVNARFPRRQMVESHLELFQLLIS